MQHCPRLIVLLALILVLNVGVSFLAGQDAKQKPVPPPEAQARIHKLLAELYADELARAKKDPATQVRLAQTFLVEGKDTTDDAAGRFVLFLAAHELAAKAGDVGTALQAAEELAQDFQVPPDKLRQMKVATLTTAANAEKAGPENYQTVVDSALLLLEDTLAADDFPASLALLSAADRAAIQLRNVPLVAAVRKRLAEVQALQKEFARWEPFARKLTTNPDDPAANAEMGFYYALIKGDWEKGLPLLARGQTRTAQIAKAELGVKTPVQLVQIAGEWYDHARQLKELPRVHALLHAYRLYLQTLASADKQEDRTALEDRLQTISKALPPEYRVGEITQESRKLDLPSGPVYDAAFSPDGRKLLAAAYDGSLRLFDVKTGKELRRLDGHVGKIWTVAFAPDGRRVASGGFDGSVRLWDLASGRELRRFPGHQGYVRSVVFSGDGRRLLSGGDDRLLRLWDVETGKELRPFPGHGHYVWGVDLAPDGQRALSGSLDKTVRLWDTATGQEIRKLTGHGDTVLSVAFSPDGRRALSGSTDRTLKLWDLATGASLQTFTGHEGYVHSVALSPDGRRALSAGADGTVRLWDVATGQELRKLEGHRDQVWSVAFSRDGRLALSTGQDGTIRIWGGSGR